MIEMGNEHFQDGIPGNGENNAEHPEHFACEYNHEDNGDRMNPERLAHDLRRNELALHQLNHRPDNDHLEQHERRGDGGDDQGRRNGDGRAEIRHDGRAGRDNGKHQRVLQADDQVADVQKGSDAAADDNLPPNVGRDLTVHFRHHHAGLRLKRRRHKADQIVRQPVSVAQQIEENERGRDNRKHRFRQSSDKIADAVHRIVKERRSPSGHTAGHFVEINILLHRQGIEEIPPLERREFILYILAVLREIVDQIQKLRADDRDDRQQNDGDNAGDEQVQDYNPVRPLHPALPFQPIHQRVQQVIGHPRENQRSCHRMQENAQRLEDKGQLVKDQNIEANQQQNKQNDHKLVVQK